MPTMYLMGNSKFKKLIFVLMFSVLSALLGQVIAQNTVMAQNAVTEQQELELTMNASWQANQIYVQTFPAGDYIPITGFVNRDAYIYLYVIYPNDFVSLNYPKTYDPTTTNNVLWASEGKSFVRFVPTADYVGLWTFVLIASLEALTFEELAKFDTPAKLVDPIFSTKWVDVDVRQARVSDGSMVSQLVKEASGLWEYFEYVRANDLFEE